MELNFHHWEFEENVRTKLGVYDRPLTEEDALRVVQLDLDNFDFRSEDVDTLSRFKNLNSLDINIGDTSSSFWDNFPCMENLYVTTWADVVDFGCFANMKKLSSLTVSGGDVSDIDYSNLHALIPLQNLHHLCLHEFGGADLSALVSMPQLKEFELRYANAVSNIDVIGSMTQLETLVLDGLKVEDLDFLDNLSDHMYLEMCGIQVLNGADPKKWKRFAKRDICEISEGEQLFAYIDLSVLDAEQTD